MSYSIDSVDCQLPCATHGRKIRARVSVSETSFPLFDGSGKRWVTVHEGSLHVIDAEGITTLLDPSSAGVLAGKAKESLPSLARAVWGVPKSGAGYVADCGRESFVIKTNKGTQTVAACILNVVSLGEHGVAILTTDGRVYVYASDSGSLNGPLSLPSQASAIACFGETHVLLVSVGSSILVFDHNGRPGGTALLPTQDLSLGSGQWAMQELIAIDSATFAAVIVQSGTEGMPDTWTAIYKCALSFGSGVTLTLDGFSCNDIFISELKFPSRAYLRWFPEVNILLASHSCADAVSLYHRDSASGRFKCFIMPEGKQLGCALDEATAQATFVRGLFLAPSVNPAAHELTIALAQSDGFLAIHTLEYPREWRVPLATLPPAPAPAAASFPAVATTFGAPGTSGGFLSAFAAQSSAAPAASVFGSFGASGAPASSSTFGSFGAPAKQPAAPAPPIPSLPTTSTPAASTSVFGSTISASGPAFGAFGGFGAAGASAQTSSGGLFGSTQPSSSFGAFGAAVQAASSISPFGGFGAVSESAKTAPVGGLFAAAAAAVPSTGGASVFGGLGQPSSSAAATAGFGGFGVGEKLSGSVFGQLGKTPESVKPKEEAPKPKAVSSLPPDPFKIAKSPIPAGMGFGATSETVGITKKPSASAAPLPPAPAPAPVPGILGSPFGSTSSPVRAPQEVGFGNCPLDVTSTGDEAKPSALPAVEVAAEVPATPRVLSVTELLANWREGDQKKAVAGDRELLNIFDLLEKELSQLETLNYAMQVAKVSEVDTKAFERELDILRVNGVDDAFASLEDECEEMNLTAKSLFFGEETLVETDSVVVGLRAKVVNVDHKISNVMKKAKIRNPQEWEMPESASPEISPVLVALGLAEKPSASKTSTLADAAPVLVCEGDAAKASKAAVGVLGLKCPLTESSKAEGEISRLKDLLRKPAEVTASLPKADIAGLDGPWKILRRIESDAKRVASLEKSAKQTALLLAETDTK